MTTDSSADGSWRLLTEADLPFVYHLITKVDPRWWRFSRGGLEPSHVLQTTRSAAAGVMLIDESGIPAACAILTDDGASGTGTLDYFALPNPHAETIARRLAPELIAAAFNGASIRRLYHERFENDPDLFGELSSMFEVEVTYPDFALVAGRYENRTISVLTAERFAEWQEVVDE